VFSVNSVHIQCAYICVKRLYVIHVDRMDESPVFMWVSHIIKHDGTWIVCGLLSIAEEYCEIAEHC